MCPFPLGARPFPDRPSRNRDTMRRATLIAALALPAVLAAGAGLTALVPQQSLAALLEERFCVARGVSCMIGSARLGLFPWPHITAQNVRVDLGGRPGLTHAHALTADLSLISLLTASPDFSTLSVQGATVVADPKLMRGAEGAAAALIEGVASQQGRWSHFKIQRCRSPCRIARPEQSAIAQRHGAMARRNGAHHLAGRAASRLG